MSSDLPISVRTVSSLCFTLAACGALACEKAPPEPEPEQWKSPAAAAHDHASETGKPAPALEPASTKQDDAPAAKGDPEGGEFTLDEATKGLEGKGKLLATIDTEKGKLECELYEDKAPVTVANFVGLARGLRPWKNPQGEWVKSAAYDGTTFHRIIKGFMIQGGDPAGTGAGEPGYVIKDEIWAGAAHDRRGLLCMANRGPNTNGMQFFITDGAAKHLDGGYTIFGECGPDKVIETLADSPVRGDRAVSPPKIDKVTIRRGSK